MDGIGTASRTRWKLRRAVALLNGIFTTLGLEKHPNKTFIGRVEKGFDFLGYCLWPDRLTVAQATVERFLARVTRLYEQEQGRPLRSAPLGSYVRRWMRWTGAGVPSLRVASGRACVPIAPPGMTEGGFVGGSWLKTNRARVEDVRNPRFKRWLREPTEKANRDEFDLAADRYAGRHGAPSGTAKTANWGSGRADQVALRTRRMPLGTARQRVPWHAGSLTTGTS